MPTSRPACRDEAIDLHQQILADRLRMPGADHPETLNSRHYLAYAYHSMGRLDKAIDLFQKIIADSERMLSLADTLNAKDRSDLTIKSPFGPHGVRKPIPTRTTTPLALAYVATFWSLSQLDVLIGHGLTVSALER
ncbi:MAG TPA: hypothetical protein DGG94_11070 [Micromonosporaceae bacterium]|nr:hypothetical protein [Micromonosporaceae bacterium]HCU50321.1 hypothetical protein [Micromonosporaceae bacterium]